MSHRAAPRPLAVCVDRLKLDLAPATTLARVQTLWEQAAGPQLAAVARPTAERDGTLTITCEASVWAQELDMMAPLLIAQTNAALGCEAIRELRCRTG